ncbi:hypothetical protein U1Q18_012819 [Sarracenia purpurea var. burkii]
MKNSLNGNNICNQRNNKPTTAYSNRHRKCRNWPEPIKLIRKKVESAGGAKEGGAAVFGAASKAEEHRRRPLDDDKWVLVAIMKNGVLDLVNGGIPGCVETEIAGGAC